MSIEEIEELPEGWHAASIAQVHTFVQYGTSAKPTEDSGGVPVLRMGNIQDGRLDVASLKFVPRTTEGLRNLLLEQGDILFNRTNSPELVGKAAVFRSPGEFTFASYLIRLRVSSTLAVPEYVCRWINSPWGREWARQVRTDGVSQSNINSKKLLAMPLPLPPLNEQKRIMGAVERILERVASARQRLKRVRVTLKRFRQAVLAAACSGELTVDWRAEFSDIASAEELLETLASERLEAGISGSSSGDIPEKWAETTLGFLTEWTLKGRPFVTSGSRGWAKFVAPEGPLFIRSENINTEYLRLEDAVRVNPPRGSETDRTRVRPGDLLLTITGNNVGRTAVVPDGCPEAYVSQHVAIIRIDRRCCTDYLWLWVQSQEHGQLELGESFYGETKPGLNLEQIKQLTVALAPVEEQHEIARRAKQLFELADAIEQRARSAFQRVELLTEAVLAKAFRGELVPTEAELARREDRSYETASELLARLKASTNGEAKRPRVRKPSKRTDGSGESLLEFMEG